LLPLASLLPGLPCVGFPALAISQLLGNFRL
jgi:hypothetical protein